MLDENEDMALPSGGSWFPLGKALTPQARRTVEKQQSQVA